MAATRRAPHAPVTGAVLLGLLAVAQAVWMALQRRMAAVAGQTAATDWPSCLVILVLVSLAGDAAARLLVAQPAAAALTMSAASACRWPRSRR